MTLTRVLTIVLLAVSFYLCYFLYSSVQEVIDTKEMIATTEAAVIERLRIIREAESVYHEQTGKYTASWDTLARFIETGRVPILQRREEIKQKAYGGEDVIVHIDTLGFVSAKERIFKKNYTINASDNGTFMGYKVAVGSQVIKNQKAYTLKVGDRINEAPFIEKGIVQSLANVKEGDQVTKGQVLINYSDYVFNPNIDLTKLGEVPGTNGKLFNIYVGRVDKGGLQVDVIEVVDPAPVDPARKESNEQKTRKPLRFGSRTDVATAGNWE